MGRLIDETDIENALKVNPCWRTASEFMRLIHGLPSAQQWIPCSERLPETLTRVLVCLEDGFVCIAYLKENYQIKDKKWLIYGADPHIGGHNIIAWQPLPEAYKEVQDD